MFEKQPTTRPYHWPEAREDARLVLQELIAGRLSEDDALDKLGFGNPPRDEGLWASSQMNER